MTLPFKGIFYESIGMSNGQFPIDDARMQSCANYELNVSECVEAYGSYKGGQMCQKFYEDLQECRASSIESMRQHLMRLERAKKVITGKIPWEKRLGPKYNSDAFIHGTFYP